MKRWCLELHYPSVGALRTDVETQLALGGLVLDTQSPDGFPDEGGVCLRFTAEGLEARELAAAVVERSATSLCVEVDDGVLGPLRQALKDVAPAAAEIPLVSFIAPDELDPARTAPSVELTMDKRIALMSVGEKIQLALHGPRDARTFLARERAGSIQMALVRNPKMTIDEVTALARSAVLAPDAADAMAKDPKLGASQQVLAALVRNPRTPIPIAVELVARLQPTELRGLAKGMSVRGPVAAAARKKLNAE